MAGNMSNTAAPITSSLSKLQALHGLFAIYKKPEAGVPTTNPRKRKTQQLKMGHGGTLDSAASGVLETKLMSGPDLDFFLLNNHLIVRCILRVIIFFKSIKTTNLTITLCLSVVGVGNGTKMLSKMLTGSKKYVAVGELGKATDTLDATGTVILEKGFEHITKPDMEDKLKYFTGDIMQVPPLYSALKKDGQRLSVLLKQGHKVEAKPARPVTVYSLTLQEFKSPLFTLDIECGGGFYVRSLVDDLGKALSSCAHVKELIRTKQGPFTLQDHALQEEQWNLENILRSLQSCSEGDQNLVPPKLPETNT
ncbi:probable tRNA pseudouridine synthase 1 isoform X2 [Kryptolebias marmoratus]|uniref:probable tRNA pseudouridine synthase 1 isoform X2 n=1 Tax=Kryptolebias marmoratus TaxID=37003 RepID=UPI0018ACB482|nr:probable tRNA pseudouridine synthase 1 isoform X2 [Kryptolebias marmoratus]